jgi:hypothetical protein
MRISLLALARRFGGVRAVTEIRMFGGLRFTVKGNMPVGVTGDDLMARLAPDEGEAALAQPGVRPMDFTGPADEGVRVRRP